MAMMTNPLRPPPLDLCRYCAHIIVNTRRVGLRYVAASPRYASYVNIVACIPCLVRRWGTTPSLPSGTIAHRGARFRSRLGWLTTGSIVI